MGRQPSRASGVKALQAIKQDRHNGKSKRSSLERGENPVPTGAAAGLKRPSSPNSIALPRAKRNALGDVTNQVKQSKKVATKKATVPQKTCAQLDTSLEQPKMSPKQETPVTQMQNVLQATKLSDDSITTETSWTNIDEAQSRDHLYSAEYAPDIFHYMHRREEHFAVEPYMCRQSDVTAPMRAILVDWLVEVQENFELFHETLYLAVRLVDLYLSRNSAVKREYLQLVGATAMLIASKFEELQPPLVDDFLYLCDDAYTHAELLQTERDILKALGYDINAPVAYRFLRRLARAADATLETHTLARYISESTLQEYHFIAEKPSAIAAASMYLALRMKKLGGWSPTLQHYSGYRLEQLLPLVVRLNTMLSSTSGQNTATVRSKYSHEVFFKVALTPALHSVELDAAQVK